MKSFAFCLITIFLCMQIAPVRSAEPQLAENWRDKVPWLQKHKTADPSKSKDPLVIALLLAADYDIYETEVLAQPFLTNKSEQQVVLMPVREDSIKTLLSLRPAWEIRITFPNKSRAKEPNVSVKLTRKLGTSSKDREKKILGKAVAIAQASLIYPESNKWFTQAQIIRVDSKSDEYDIFLSDLPGYPGGDCSIYVTKDLKYYRLQPGY